MHYRNRAPQFAGLADKELHGCNPDTFTTGPGSYDQSACPSVFLYTGHKFMVYDLLIRVTLGSHFPMALLRVFQGPTDLKQGY